MRGDDEVRPLFEFRAFSYRRNKDEKIVDMVIIKGIDRNSVAKIVGIKN